MGEDGAESGESGVAGGGNYEGFHAFSDILVDHRWDRAPFVGAVVMPIFEFEPDFVCQSEPLLQLWYRELRSFHMSCQFRKIRV